MNIHELLIALEDTALEVFHLHEMANFRGAKFNLPVNVWIDGPREMPHGKRIKIQNNYSTNFTPNDLLTITISDEPKLEKSFKKVKVKEKDVAKVKTWVKENKTTLENYGNGELDTEELIDHLKPYTE